MQVIGIMLVRNEDLFVEWSLRNAIDFCDELIIADHQSRDKTPEILRCFAAKYPEKVHYHEIRHPRESHPLIRKYAGSDSWIFGVDGDEIYDPVALKKFRIQLQDGVYKNEWAVFGNVLNVKALQSEQKVATGFQAPPCRSMTKLYNFAAITDWGGDCLERLHGGKVIFFPGFDETKRFDYYKVTPWDASLFRCLHLCFLKRSSMDQADTPRLNIMDRYAWNKEKILQKISHLLRGKVSQNWKEEKYARGESSTVDISNFLLSEGALPYLSS